MECSASIAVTFNGVWRKLKKTNNSTIGFDEASTSKEIIYPGETLICEAIFWAWWRAQYANVNYVRFYKYSYNGKQLLYLTIYHY